MAGFAGRVLFGQVSKSGTAIKQGGEQLLAGLFLAHAFLNVVRGGCEKDVADRHQGRTAEAGRVGGVEALAVLLGGLRDVEFQFQHAGDAVFFVGDVAQLEAAGLLQEQFADHKASGGLVPGFGDFLGRVVLHFPGDVVFADQDVTHVDRGELVSGLFGFANRDQLHDGYLLIWLSDYASLIRPTCIRGLYGALSDYGFA